MRRQLLELYVGALLWMVSTLALTLWLAWPSFEASATRQARSLLETPMRRIAWALDAGVSADALEDELNSAVSLVPWSDAPAEVVAALRASEIAVTIERREIWGWVALSDQQAVARVGPVAQVKPERSGRGLKALGVGLFLSFPAVWLVGRPLGRQLLLLSRAADLLGEGDLTARVPVLRSDAAGQLAERFNAMADQLGALIEAQQELLRAVSHDLRTPMSRMRFSLTLLEDAPPEQSGRHLTRLGTDLDAMERLLQELLRYVRLRGEPVTETEPVALGPMLARLREELSMLRPALTVELAAGPEVTVRCEPAKLHRALENVGANATRFATQRVKLSWQRTASAVEIRIEDDGPGIPEADRQRVFEPFVRLEGARNLDQHSSGLGLAIAHQIVARHQGQISIEDVQEGTVVLIRLPRSREA